MNPTRWVALHCGEEAETLLARHPNAFLLLCQIAMRARWKDCPITKMKKGEAFIGDWKAAGLHSEKAYQVAKKRLASCGLVEFQGGNRGTTAKLVDSTIFSLSQSIKGELEDRPETDKGRPKGEQGATIHTEHKEHPDTLTTSNDKDLFSLPEKHSAKKSKAKGTLDELKAFAIEIELPESDGEDCFNRWEGNGWKNNGKPIVDWQATMRTWKGRRFLASQQNPQLGMKGGAAGSPLREWEKPQPNRITPDLGPRGQNYDVMDLNEPPADDAGEPFAPSNDTLDLPSIVAAYPRREGVAEALGHLTTSLRKGADPQTILTGTRAIAAVIGQMPSGALNAYVVSAATFFRNERWRDDPATWQRSGAAKNGATREPLNLGGRKVAETIRVNSAGEPVRMNS